MSISSFRAIRRVMESKHATLDGTALEHVSVSFKADTVDNNARTFEGLASVWGLDLGDDVMHRGAFKETIAEWAKSTDAIPLLNSHNHFDVMSAVGQLLDAKETKDGLWTKWEVIDGADGDAVLTRLRPSARTGRAAVSKMSIGYEPAKFDMEESDKARFGIVRNLRKVNLKEVSLVIFPMAPGARIDVQSVKSLSLDELKALNERLANADPSAFGDAELLEFRRANTRIGFLMSSRKATPTLPATPAAPATPSTSPEPTPPAPAAPTPTPTDPPAPATPAPAAPATAEDEGTTTDVKAEPIYEPLYSEALGINIGTLLDRNRNLFDNR